MKLSQKKYIRIWRTDTGEKVKELSLNYFNLNDIQINKNNTFLVCIYDNILSLFKLDGIPDINNILQYQLVILG